MSARLIFTAEQGGMVWRSNFNGKEWKPALAVAGLIPEADQNGKCDSAREHGMHALRHFYASALLDAGENIKAVSEYTGHADPAMTLRVYATWCPTAESVPVELSVPFFSAWPGKITAHTRPGRTPTAPGLSICTCQGPFLREKALNFLNSAFGREGQGHHRGTTESKESGGWYRWDLLSFC
ncbi:tyrosine-type recombinase/integrase [Streptomyces sp. NPDC088354]|uniref:tyrosine-type recombinase/integrase n=1 Tax=Streptomyces sp. NPDC088354 TaxID=3365856 RepID=UPI003817DD19